jgi:hypothetical protein
VPGAKKSGLGAMLPDGFEIESAGALVTGLIVVVGVGATVVGVTTVVGVGVVGVGLVEPFGLGRTWLVVEEVTMWECRIFDVVTRTTRRTPLIVVVVVGATVVVVAIVVLVVPILKPVLGETTFAMAGRAVVLRITPRTSEPIEPTKTERRGPRRDAEERHLGSPERFCPCVILVMDQLSKTNITAEPTVNQQFVKSNELPPIQRKSFTHRRLSARVELTFLGRGVRLSGDRWSS